METNLNTTESELKPIFTKLDLEKFTNPSFKNERSIRFVCISDTHSSADKITIPDGDVLIFSGDFTYSGQPAEVEKFKNFLKSVPHKQKIMIAGNHDKTFDMDKYTKLKNHRKFGNLLPEKVEDFKNSFFEGVEGLHYLENSSANVYGYEIYGSPFTPIYFNMAFQKFEGKLKEIWKEIPDKTDIVVTHGPPKFIGDYTVSEIHAGSLSLLNEIQKRIKPKYHIFGHIHEGYGVYQDENTTYINCAIMNVKYFPKNLPIVFDLPIRL